MTGRDGNRDSQTPFPAHRTYYMALKIAVLAAAVALGTKLLGMW